MGVLQLAQVKCSGCQSLFIASTASSLIWSLQAEQRRRSLLLKLILMNSLYNALSLAPCYCRGIVWYAVQFANKHRTCLGGACCIVSSQEALVYGSMVELVTVDSDGVSDEKEIRCKRVSWLNLANQSLFILFLLNFPKVPKRLSHSE